MQSGANFDLNVLSTGHTVKPLFVAHRPQIFDRSGGVGHN
jgi:hypothetical protein